MKTVGIELDNVTKKFGDLVVFRNVNLSITSGIYHLIGRNGAGKTTLLRMIAGLDKNYSGKITVKGKNILYLTVDPVGIRPFTFRENLEILWNVFKIKPTSKQIAAIEDFFDGKIDTPYEKGSTGMKAKLGLSLVFVKDWDIVLIDESMSALDSRSVEMLVDRFVSMSENSVIIYVSHSTINKLLFDISNEIHIDKEKIITKS